jgi:carbonic anhydrase
VDALAARGEEESRMMRATGLLLLALAFTIPQASPKAAGAAHTAHSSASEADIVPADLALERLREGNRRFVAGTSAANALRTVQRRVETARGQHPFAVVVGCADSRTAPEILFDQGLGDLFVLRTAGNLVEDYALGSIEYAVEHLGTRLVIVMGHERCGAVSAAVSAAESADSAPGHLNAIVREIGPAVAEAKEKTKLRGGDITVAAVRRNAARIASRIRAEARLERFPDVRVVAAYYNLESGVVEWAP